MIDTLLDLQCGRDDEVPLSKGGCTSALLCRTLCGEQRQGIREYLRSIGKADCERSPRLEDLRVGLQ